MPPQTFESAAGQFPISTTARLLTPSSLKNIANLVVSYVFATFQTSLENDARTRTASRTIPTFLTLYIFGFLYQLLLAYDALRLKNTIQVIGLCIFNAALLLYAAVQIEQIQDAVHDLLANKDIDNNVWTDTKAFLIAIPCIIAVGTILLSLVAWKLYDEFAWTIYKHISADLRMKRRYLTFQIYIALLKFDFFLFIGFTIQFVVIVVRQDDIEFWLTIAAIPVTILILIMAGIFTRRENRLGMASVIVGYTFLKTSSSSRLLIDPQTLYFVALAYFLFKLVRMYQRTYEKTFLPIRKSLTTFAIITIILIIATIVNAIMCTMNFGKGLKPHIAGRKMESEDEKTFVTEMPNLSHGPVPSRMTID